MKMERKEAHSIQICLILMREQLRSLNGRTVSGRAPRIGSTRTIPQCSLLLCQIGVVRQVVALIIRAEVLRVLSKYGANFKVKDFDGNNLVHLALKYKSAEAL